MDEIFIKCQKFRDAGQKEYAQSEDNAFANFDRVGSQLNLDRKKVLWTYAYKHIDGIVSAINGHVSQREPVEGRICDLIVYLILLAGMFKEDEPMHKNGWSNQNKIGGLDYQSRSQE